ncbi:MAG: hypothetical protein JHD16_16240 [Solirubrobacteraceae bacterium]|nr:hypothetical protein [Solirubrobacteraceae bacterium]
MSSIGSGSLSLTQSQAQWDAIASIKATSPFDGGGSGGAAASTVASGFDAMLSGYTAQAQLLSAAAAPDAGTTTALLNQLASVQQSTIDLFA